MTRQMTVHHVVALVEAKRDAVRAELDELRREGVKVLVDADTLLLCELVGLVVDLERGTIVGRADDRFSIDPEQPAESLGLASRCNGDTRPRAVLYARTGGVSTRDLERQLELCHQVAAAENFCVVAELQEFAAPIVPMPPQLQRALLLVQTGEAEALIVSDESSLGRAHVSQQVRSILLQAGGRLVYRMAPKRLPSTTPAPTFSQLSVE